MQPAWWCRSCGTTELYAHGWCRPCYDRRRRSQRYFGGHREAVLCRDRCCQLCLAEKRLIVHHRYRLPGFYSDLFLELWRELHPDLPIQLRLPLAA